jgi:arylformamidase
MKTTPKTATKLIDLSQPMWDGCPNCPTHPLVEVEVIADHSRGEWHMEHLKLASHTGSHIDAPLHKMPGGKTIDQLPLETFIGQAFAADLRPLEPEAEINVQVLASALGHVEEQLRDSIVLLCTGWGQKRECNNEWFYRAPFLTLDGAQWLVDKGVRGAGIDHFSIGGAQEPRNGNTHTVLLGAETWILEELCFPEEVWALPQPWKFWALPINLRAHSGAWCRPVIEVSTDS